MGVDHTPSRVVRTGMHEDTRPSARPVDGQRHTPHHHPSAPQDSAGLGPVLPGSTWLAAAAPAERWRPGCRRGPPAHGDTRRSENLEGPNKNQPTKQAKRTPQSRMCTHTHTLRFKILTRTGPQATTGGNGGEGTPDTPHSPRSFCLEAARAALCRSS